MMIPDEYLKQYASLHKPIHDEELSSYSQSLYGDIDACNRIDDCLTEYLGIAVNEKLSEVINTAGDTVRI